MSATPPVFGPTEIIGDDEQPTLAIVQLAIALPREQLRAALAIGHAQMAGEPPLDEMSVLDVRREVEGYLGAASIVDLYRETAVVTKRITPEHAVELDSAIDRAYSRPAPAPKAKQDPRYGEGTVTLQTLDHGEVTVPEPAWCVGHDDDIVGHLADTTHNGAIVTTDATTSRHGQMRIMEAQLIQAPHGELRPEPLPLLSIRVDLDATVATEDARSISRALRVASVRLDRAIAGLAHLRGEKR
ncbi:DUF6907 domain-containing protein [Streptomyces sp. NPDC057381]|uniref:DUF6907 domain-containing protein n=1 Tax=Streptomyces sp. NPDC057381 TaxID=3346111 RepID=UPI00363C52CA